MKSLIDSLQTVTVGTVGIVGSGVVNDVVASMPVAHTEWTTAITQVIIALATLVSLFKRKKPNV